MLRFVLKRRQNAVKYSKLCFAGIQIRKYILQWTCVYWINYKIRNSKIEANFSTKIKVVRESPMYLLHQQSAEPCCYLWASFFLVGLANVCAVNVKNISTFRSVVHLIRGIRQWTKPWIIWKYRDRERDLSHRPWAEPFFDQLALLSL